MSIKNSIFSIFNLLFKYCYWAYKPLYFIYKQLSDRNQIKYLKTNVQEGDIVLDIGANIGFYSQLLSKQVGDTGLVLAFEPDEISFTRLKKNVEHKTNICISKSAVSNSTCELDFYISDKLNVDHQTLYWRKQGGGSGTVCQH